MQELSLKSDLLWPILGMKQWSVLQKLLTKVLLPHVMTSTEAAPWWPPPAAGTLLFHPGVQHHVGFVRVWFLDTPRPATTSLATARSWPGWVAVRRMESGWTAWSLVWDAFSVYSFYIERLVEICFLISKVRFIGAGNGSG